MARLVLFGPARQAAGVSQAEVAATTVAGVCDEAARRFGPGFADLLPTCALWVNGEPAERDGAVGPGDEVAVIPPVSGGA